METGIDHKRADTDPPTPEAQLGERTDAERDALQAELLRGFLAETTDVVYFKDLEGRILAASEPLEENLRSHGLPGAIGRTDFDLHPAMASKTYAEEQEIIRTGEPKLNVIQKAVTAHGTSVVWNITSKFPLRNDRDEIIGTFGITRIRTERSALGDEAHGGQPVHWALETQRVAAGHANVEAIMAAVCARCQDLTGATGTSVLVPDDNGDLRIVASSGSPGALADHVFPTESVSGTAFASQEAVLCHDLEQWGQMGGFEPPPGVRSVLSVPLLRGDHTVGVLTVVSSTPSAFEEEDARTLDLLALVLSGALSRASEVEARRSEADALARFQAVFDGAAIGIVRAARNGQITEANPTIEQKLGFAAEGLSKIKLLDAFHPDDRPQIAALHEQLWNGKVTSYRGEFRGLRTDGESVWTHITTVLEPAEDSPSFTVTMIEDVSDRHIVEEQLRQAQKIDAIGQLSAGVAHDFNNLLMGVLGYAELAQISLADDAPGRPYVDRIIEAAQRAADLTRQLLAFGRRQTLAPQIVELNELIVETNAMLTRILGEQIVVSTELEPRLASVRADPTQLQQVLLNLALNSRDAMPSGGLLRIATANCELDESDPGLQLAAGSYVLLMVADTGSGMTPEVLERIFEPFFTTKGVAEGTGLGLSSTHGIVKQSGGEIAVESAPGNGTTFRIYLPAVVEDTPAVTPPIEKTDSASP